MRFETATFQLQAINLCKSFKNFLCPKVERYDLKHKEIYTDFVVFLPDYLISPRFSIRFSPNSTIS